MGLRQSLSCGTVHFFIALSHCVLLCFVTSTLHADPVPVATSTVLTVSPSSNPDTPHLVTLVATVSYADKPVLTGLVTFSDNGRPVASVRVVRIASAHFTPGTATLKHEFAAGPHNFTATFHSTVALQSSTSASQALTLPGTVPTATTLSATGSPNNYTLTAAVSAFTPAPITGSVSIVDTDNENRVLGSASLSSPPIPFALVLPTHYNPAFGGGADAVTGDFNGDGFPDLLFVSGTTLSLYRGTYGGGFLSPLNMSWSSLGGDEENIAYLVVDDFNGDGILDLVISSTFMGPCCEPVISSIYFFNGNSDGSFTMTDSTNDGASGVYAGPFVPLEADFKGDGMPELNFEYNGNLAGVTLSDPGDPVFAVDVNGDGKDDIIEGGFGGLVYLSNGDDSFQAPVTFNPAGTGISGLALGDFNGDGIPDLAIESGNYLTLNIVLGQEGGSYSLADSYEVRPDKISVADVNGDGIPDLIYSNFQILIGNGDGSFQSPLSFPVGYSSRIINVQDYNGDGLVDMAAVDYGDGSIYLQLGQPAQASATLSDFTIPGDTAKHKVAAVYSGNSLLTTSTSPAITLTGEGLDLATTVAIQPSATNVVYGTPLSLGVTVAAAGNQNTTPTGTVTFTSGSTALGTVTLVNAQATLQTVTPLPAGTQTIAATYSGDSTFEKSTGTVTITVTKAVPAVTWATPQSITYGVGLGGGQLNATASVPGSFVYTPAAGTVLNAGTQALSVTFTPTDTADYTAQTQSVQLVVKQAATSTGVNASPILSTYGHTFTLTSRVRSGSLTPTGSVTFQSGGTVLGTAALTTGEVSLENTTPLPVGKDTITASYSGDGNFLASTGSVTITVSKAGPAIAWSIPQPISYGIPLSAAQLDATASVPGTFVYTPAAGAVLDAGTHSLSVTFTPTDTANYIDQTKTVSITVDKAASTTALTPSAATSTFGLPLTFTARVHSPGGSPTGKVTFTDGTLALGAITLDGSGEAIYSSTTLSVGSHTLTASYGGSVDFATSVSTSVSVTVVAPPKPDFTLQASPPNLTVLQGRHGTATFTLKPTGGFTGSVDLSCGTLPTGASCAFSPQTLTANGDNASLSSQLVLSTTADDGISASARESMPARDEPFLAGFLFLPALLMGFWIGVRNRHALPRAKGVLIVTLLLAGVIFSLAGCGGGGMKKPAANATPPGTYAVSITAATTGSGAVSHSIALTLKVE